MDKNNFFNVINILTIAFPLSLIGIYLVGKLIESIFREYYCIICNKDLDRRSKKEKKAKVKHYIKKEQVKCLKK